MPPDHRQPASLRSSHLSVSSGTPAHADLEEQRVPAGELPLNRAERAQIPDSATEALDLPVGKSGRACILELGDGFPKLDLTELHGPSNRPPLANDDVGMVRLCLASGDLQADYTRLQEQGVTFISQPLPTQDGRADIAVCVDPDGCLIELIQVHLENW